MGVLNLVESHKNDLKFLQEQSAQILADFCKLAWNFLTKGANTKLYQAISQKLQLDVKLIQSGVEGLANFFIESGKSELNEEEFQAAVTDLGFPHDLAAVIYKEYLNQRNILLSSLPQAGIQHLQFKNLEWRFETQVSSKSLKNQIQPRVVIKLDLEKQGETKSVCLQSNISNIIHTSQVIGQAVQDSKTQHYKRIQRAVA